jgi:hypothetical protein
MSKITSPRDPASGLPTGQRMHKPITVTSQNAPRDPASGLPTGKATQSTVKDTFTSSAKSHAIVSPRDSASGQATGKRQYRPVGF